MFPSPYLTKEESCRIWRTASPIAAAEFGRKEANQRHVLQRRPELVGAVVIKNLACHGFENRRARQARTQRLQQFASIETGLSGQRERLAISGVQTVDVVQQFEGIA